MLGRHLAAVVANPSHCVMPVAPQSVRRRRLRFLVACSTSSPLRAAQLNCDQFSRFMATDAPTAASCVCCNEIIIGRNVRRGRHETHFRRPADRHDPIVTLYSICRHRSPFHRVNLGSHRHPVCLLCDFQLKISLLSCNSSQKAVLTCFPCCSCNCGQEFG